jgi:tetratricopeptide (TPR) repeat protein
MLGNHAECIADCDEVTRVEPSNAKAYLRKAKALVQLGRLSEAAFALEAGLSAVTGPPPAYGEPPPTFDKDRSESITSLQEELDKTRGLQSLLDAGKAKLTEGEYGEAARLFGEVMHHCDASNVQLLAARAQLGVGMCDWAIRVTLQVLRREPQNASAYAVRSEALFLVREPTTTAVFTTIVCT